MLRSPKPDLQGAVRKALAACSEQRAACVSVVAFGSCVTGGCDAASDVDLIVVVADEVPDSRLAVLRRRASEEVQPAVEGQGEPGASRALRSALNHIGAQHKGTFVCRKSEFRRGDARRIFAPAHPLDTAILDNPFLANDLGLRSILLTAVTAHGEDLLADLAAHPEPIGRTEVLQNAVTYSLLNALAIATHRVTPDAILYSLSAVKWSVRTFAFVTSGRTSPLAEEIAGCRARHGDAVLERTLELRHTKQWSLRYALGAQWLIARIFFDLLVRRRYPVHLS